MNECEICFRCTDSFELKVRMMRLCPITIHSFSVRIDVLSSFRMIPYQSERNSYFVWIGLITQIHSEWYRAIPSSVRMIPCHTTRAQSIAHSNGLGSEWFGNRFRIHTESFSFRMSPILASCTFGVMNDRRSEHEKSIRFFVLYCQFAISIFCSNIRPAAWVLWRVMASHWVDQNVYFRITVVILKIK